MLLGEALVYVFKLPLPGPVLGMVVLTIGLAALPRLREAVRPLAQGVLGHLSLADGVNISAATVVTRSIRQPGLYTGMFPIDDNAAWEKNAATLRQLHTLRDRIRALEKNDSPGQP